MGNRAVITTKENLEKNGLGVYVHWCGGREYVTAFTKYCKARGFRRPEDDCYGWARLTQVIANSMGKDGLSVGIDVVNRLDCDNYDNGTYLIEDWEIVGRMYNWDDADVDEEELKTMIRDINKDQPEEQQLTDEELEEFFKKGM